jgi:hypothetical protein
MIRANPKTRKFQVFVSWEIANKMGQIKAAENRKNPSTLETIHINKIITHT